MAQSIGMLSKNTVKFIKSLHQKKYRTSAERFFVEGEKSVLELLSSDYVLESLYVSPLFAEKHADLLGRLRIPWEVVSQQQLEQIGQYKSNDAALAVVEMKENKPLLLNKGEWCLALDEVRDPGNLGTILRIADWFGFRKVLLSKQSADVYNPKVIQSSMGSFCRVEFFYGDLEAQFRQVSLPVYGACMEGDSIHKVEELEAGILLLGNESRGISKELQPYLRQKLSVPSFGKAESLNVAIATAILCDNLKRLDNNS